MNHYEKLKHLVMDLEEDFRKFHEKGNNAAGTRARQGMQSIKEMAQAIRKDIQDIKNNSSK